MWNRGTTDFVFKVLRDHHRRACTIAANATGAWRNDYIIQYEGDRPRWVPNVLADAQCKILQIAAKRKRAEAVAPDAVEEVRQNATRIQREGPCYFGHDFTTSMYKGQPQWTANPEPSFWYDVEPGVSLCQKCYTRGRAAMIR